MSPTDSILVITTLAGVISVLTGFIVATFRDALKRGDGRIEVLEKREDLTLTTMATNINAVLDLMKVMAEMVKELRLLAEVEHRSRGPGGT